MASLVLFGNSALRLGVSVRRCCVHVVCCVDCTHCRGTGVVWKLKNVKIPWDFGQ